MNPESRVWIYTSDRILNNGEVTTCETDVKDFINNWQSHGNDVKGSFKLCHGCLLVIVADESDEKTGGCSIDSSFRMIQNLEEKLDISLLNRQVLTFLIDTKVIQLPLNEIKTHQKILENKDSKIFFNNLVKNLTELNTNWLVEPEESWIKNYL